ncbi:MlaD family protein [Myxococcota bacterium]|nr:MlaD family protein [Myxococcota bacterium]
MSRPRYEIGVGLLMLAGAGVLGFMAMKTGAVREIGDFVEVEAVFDDVAGLKTGAAVAISGIDVGQVTDMVVEFDKARVRLIVKRSAGVRKDVIARVRARSVLGEKFVELEPQSPDAPALESGDVLTDTRTSVEIDQLVTSLGPMVNGLDPKKLDALLDALVKTLEQDPERVDRMLVDAEALLHNARIASDDAPALVAEARATLGEVRGLTRQATPMVKDGAALMVRVDGVLTEVETFSGELPAVAERLPGMLDDVELTLEESRELVVVLSGNKDRIEQILMNIEEIDKWELRRLLREEGIKMRVFASEVEETPPE